MEKDPRSIAIATVLMLGMSTGIARSSPQIEPFGLSGTVVTSLGTFNALYAGTLEGGVFRRDLSNPNADWMSLGLENKHVRAVYPHSTGPLGFTTTAGLEGDPLKPDSALVYCSDMDQPPWIEADDGMVRSDVIAVWSLDGFPSPAICGETFATTIGSKGGVWRRGFGSPSWEFVLDIGFGVGNVVRTDHASGNVWAGGENALLAPWIARSTDQGDTWHVAYPDLSGDNACNSIALHPDDPDVALAGMEGSVIETTDGGATWQPTGLTGTQAYIYGVAFDSSTPLHVLAGGMVQFPNNWALWESVDGGDTWSEIPSPTLDPPGQVTGVLAIEADPVRAGVFYIATRGHGAWKLTSTATGVGDLPDLRIALGQNHPNPFRRNTTLSFVIPTKSEGSHVRLAVYTVRGERVRVLIDERMGAGARLKTWDGTGAQGQPMPSGVYYACLQIGSEVASRKLHLIR